MAVDGNARPQFKYSHQSGAISNVQIKTGPGTLRSIVVNTSGAAVGAITVQDGIVGQSPATIAVITPVTGTSVIPATAIYDLAFLGGLIVTGSGANVDFTVSYI